MARSKTVSVREVARVSGVAASTVSRVLNKNPNVPITQKTRDRVIKVAKELGYQPNIHAKRLFGCKSNVLGMIIPPFAKLVDKNCGLRHVDTTLAETMNGAIDMARRHGYHIMTILSDEAFIENKEYLNLFRSQSVDGMLIWGICLDENYIQELVEDKCEFVLLNTHLRTGKFHRVYVDNYSGSADLCKRLIELGHTRIGYICGREDSTVGIERKMGFIDTLNEAGLYDADLIVNGDYSLESGKRGCVELLKRGTNLTAIGCANDIMAYGVLDILDERNIPVPDEMSVTGADASFSSVLPRLTSYSPPFYEMGQKGAELLIKSIDGKGTTQEFEAVFETSMYPGHSIGPARKVE